MENLDVTAPRQGRDWRMQGTKVLLATVVRTWGSSPQPVGPIMALCKFISPPNRPDRHAPLACQL